MTPITLAIFDVTWHFGGHQKVNDSSSVAFVTMKIATSAGDSRRYLSWKHLLSYRYFTAKLTV